MLKNPDNGYIYKIETHCHTAEVSPCGTAPYRDLIDGYAAAGYSAITLCDHLRLDYSLPRDGDRAAVVDHLIEIYDAAEEYVSTR